MIVYVVIMGCFCNCDKSGNKRGNLQNRLISFATLNDFLLIAWALKKKHDLAKPYHGCAKEELGQVGTVNPIPEWENNRISLVPGCDRCTLLLLKSKRLCASLEKLRKGGIGIVTASSLGEISVTLNEVCPKMVSVFKPWWGVVAHVGTMNECKGLNRRWCSVELHCMIIDSKSLEHVEHKWEKPLNVLYCSVAGC